MTVIGSVEVEVRALVDGGAVTRQVNQQLQRPMENAGKAAGKTMGQHVGQSAAQELERSGARFARSGRLLANVFTSNSAAALGPLQEVADKVELIGSTLDRTRTKAGGALLGIGAAATGVGAFLSTLESREKGATNRLAASIAANGGSIDDYRAQIDEAVKSGEKFGQSGNQTIDAIQALTIGLHDPKKALEELGLAEDIAAAKQIPLSSAANLVRQAYNGNTRVLKAFGIQVADVVDGQKLLKDAHDGAGKASSEASKAQKDYSDKLAIYRDTLTPTLSQQIALKNAHDKLVTATAAQATAQKQLTDAQAKANAAGGKGQQVLEQLARVTAGQASASADTFTGRLKAVGAAIEDNAAKVGGVAGKKLIEFGPAMAGVGFLIESGLIPKIGRGVLGLLGLGGQAAATAVEMEASSATEVASLQTVVAAIGELQLALTGIGPAMTAQTAIVEENAAAQAAALDAEAASASNLRGILAGIGGVTLGIVGAGITVAVKEAMDTNALTGSLDKQVKQLRGMEQSATTNDELTAAINAAVAKARKLGAQFDSHGEIVTIGGDAKHANERSRGAEILTDVQNARKFLAGQGNAADSNAQDAKDAAHARTRGKMIGSAAAQGAREAAKPETLEQFLARNHLGSVASSAMKKALTDAQKAAGDQAKAIGKTVTDGIKAQVASVKKEISDVNAEIKKIADVRGAVVGQAGQFTSLSNLLPDVSLATAGGLISSERSRNAALGLFGTNLTSLSRRGLDKGEIADILKEGPERGRAIAAALAQGSDAQLRQLNLELKAGRQQAQVLGDEAVTAQFGAGAQAKANAELAKLNRQVATLNKQIAAEPALIAKAVDQAQKNAKVTTKTASRTAVTR